MPSKIEVEFVNGKKIFVANMDSEILMQLQEEHKSVIVKIDGQPSPYYGMSKEQVNKELNRVGINKAERVEAIKIYQNNCRHDKGYITNTGMDGSKCVLCGKPLF